MRSFTLMSLSTILLSVYAGQAHSAGTVTKGYIENIAVNFAGTARIKLSGVEGLEACGESYLGFAIDVNT